MTPRKAVMAKPAFCASCTDEREDLVLRGVVWLCPDCDPESLEQRPERPATFRGYDVPEQAPKIGKILDAFRRAEQAVAPGHSPIAEGRALARAARPGFVLVRVARTENGVIRDAQEARETLRGEPWFAELNYIGLFQGVFIFDRPDQEAAQRARRRDINAMDELRADVERAAALEHLAELLGRYAFRPANEGQLQDQVAGILERAGLAADREVRADARSRYDLLVALPGAGRVVLELKLAATAPAVERQAQRYAAAADVDAVVVVTTSSRLAHELRRAGSDQLGGKPFAVIALRSF